MNLVQFPANGLASTNKDVAEYLRRIAFDIETGDEVKHVVILIESSEGLLSRRITGQPLDHARLVGLITCAAHRAMDGAL